MYSMFNINTMLCIQSELGGPETHHTLFRLLNEIITIDVGGVGYHD